MALPSRGFLSKYSYLVSSFPLVVRKVGAEQLLEAVGNGWPGIVVQGLLVLSPSTTLNQNIPDESCRDREAPTEADVFVVALKLRCICWFFVCFVSKGEVI